MRDTYEGGGGLGCRMGVPSDGRSRGGVKAEKRPDDNGIISTGHALKII